MENQTGNDDPQNVEKVALADTDSPDAIKEKFSKLDQEHTKTLELNRQLFERAKKAEGFEKDGEGNWIKTVVKEAPKPKAKEATQSDGLDYGQKAFLKSSGIKKEEFEFVEKQIEESGIKDIEKLLDNGYFQSQLQAERDSAESRAATPKSGEGAGGGESPKSKADYWLDKGELPPNTPENQELRREVVRKKSEIAKTSQRFTRQPVIYGSGTKQ